jgi:NADPH:quinone reductase-like Zn-dependent oxidoreductase
MKAVVHTAYGTPDVLRLAQVTKPQPKDDEVLIKVHAASVNAADSLLMRGETTLARLIAGGLRRPKRPTPGIDLAGRVEAVGPAVTRFSPGDAVYGDLSSCDARAFAEYAAVPQQYLAHKPANLSFAEAAAVPLASVTALQSLRHRGAVQRGHKVLIVGAGGGVGTFAVQLAQHFGAHVTAVCSTGKVAVVRELGAARVVDYTREDVTRSSDQYDLILDLAAYRPFAAYRPILKKGGRYVVAGGAYRSIFRAMLLGPFISPVAGVSYSNIAATPDIDDLRLITTLIEQGAIKPVIDRCFPLEAAADALRHFESGQAYGKTIVVVVPEAASA